MEVELLKKSDSVSVHDSSAVFGLQHSLTKLSTTSSSYLCTQCRSIDFNCILDGISQEGAGGSGIEPFVVGTRVGLDTECALCQQLATYVLPGTYGTIPGPEFEWTLRAHTLRNMLVETRTSNLFRGVSAGFLYAGEGERDYIKHINDEKIEKAGMLAFAKTSTLKERLEEEIVLGAGREVDSTLGSERENDDEDEEAETRAHVDMEHFESDNESDESVDLASEPEVEIEACRGQRSYSNDEGYSGSEDDDEADTDDDSEQEEQDSHASTRFISDRYDRDIVRQWLRYWDVDPRNIENRPTGSRCEAVTSDIDDQANTTNHRGDLYGRGRLHHSIHRALGSGTDIGGMMVIDCETSNIVPRTAEMRYITLSYVWRLAHNDMVLLGTRYKSKPASGKQLPESVPRVVHNAIEVAIDLGFRYLWVDQFCINQDAPRAEIAEQISKMDLIYSQSELTIIATSSCGALPGVGTTRRSRQVVCNLKPPKVEADSAEESITIFSTPPPVHFSIRESVWFSRGWCFQESLLSPRRLYFTDHQTFFESEGIHCCEAYPIPHDSVDLMLDADFEDNPSLMWPWSWDERLGEYSRNPFSPSDPRGRFWAETTAFLELVSVYTGKSLSHGSDSINGFRGAMRVFSQHDPRFDTIQGLPVMRLSGLEEQADSGTEYDMETFAKNMFRSALTWIHRRNEFEEVPIRRPEFPSWSWAGWQGKVVWENLGFPRGHDDDFDPIKLDILYVEGKGGKLLDFGNVMLPISSGFNAAHTITCEGLIVDGDDVYFQDTHDNFRGSVLELQWRGRGWGRPKAYLSIEGMKLPPSALDLQHVMARKVKSGSWGLILLRVCHWGESHVQGDSNRPARDGLEFLVVSWVVGGQSAEQGSEHPRVGVRIGIIEYSKQCGTPDACVEDDLEDVPRITFQLQ